jgi:flagellar motor switch/type III secretory pathway protein FliN
MDGEDRSMSYTLRPAVTSEAKPLIGLYSESGCGKTYSSLLLAKGFAGDMSKVAMIETESGRGEVFADDPLVGGYFVRPIRENFSPTEYGKAISEVEKAGVRVMIIDSASHEWEGNQGVLGMAAKNQAYGKKGPLVWQQPKMDHQREFMLRLMQTPVPLVVVCMRAKYPMEEIVDKGEKKWVRSKELSPKQSDDILFEMMVHAWIDQQHRAHVTKYTKDAFKAVFLDGQPITVDTGKRLAEWAAGRTKGGEATDPKNADGASGRSSESTGRNVAGGVSGNGGAPAIDYAAALRVCASEQALRECYDAVPWEDLDSSQVELLTKVGREMKAKLKAGTAA